MKRRRYIRVLIIIAFLFFGVELFSSKIVFAVPPVNIPELSSQINEKSKELESINQKIQQTESIVSSLTNQKRTLKNDINKLDYTVNQLDLNIESNKITIEKLNLEIELLQNQKLSIENSTENKRQALADVLTTMQQNDSKGIIYVLLKNMSLADSVSEMQNLFDLEDKLSLRVTELKNLHTELINNIDVTEEKKGDIEDEKNDLTYRKDIVDEQKKEKSSILSETKNKETLYQQELDTLQEKQQEIEQIIADIEDKLRATFDPSALPTERPGVIEYPVSKPRISQCYGATAFARTAYKSGIHSGVDFAAPIGTRVYAVDDGIVRRVDNNDLSSLRKYQFGKYILIDHPNNLTTLYAHLSQYIVSPGEQVKRGQLIGYVGNTGYSTGAHLHFGLYSTVTIQLKSIPPAQGLVPLGVHINPIPYLPSTVERNKCL
ncbi:MAG: peptidoglycan DD-metalloendopeptidase family protein [bacterium]